MSLGTCGVPVNMGSLTLFPEGAERPVPAHGGGVPLDADDREGLGIPQRECPVGGDTGERSLSVPRRLLSLRENKTRLRRKRWVVTDGGPTHPPPLVPAPSSAAGSSTHRAKPIPGSGITKSRGILLPGGAKPREQRAVLADHRLLRLVQGA